MPHSQEWKISSGLLEISPFKNDQGEYIGKHPDEITKDQIKAIGLDPPLTAIRMNCLECAGAPIEVRKCVCTSCPFWLMRFGKRPKAARKKTVNNLPQFRGSE